MAYLDLQSVASGGGATVMVPPPGLSDAEQHVLLLARKDPLSSIHQPSAISAWVRRQLGRRKPNHLANSRLEALRRFGILVRVGRDDGEALRKIEAAGFSAAQIEEVRRRVPYVGPNVPWRQGMLSVSALAIWIGAFFVVNTKLEDPEASFLVVATLGLVPLILFSRVLLGKEGRQGHEY